MMTEKQLRASEEAARSAPADKDGIWVNVSSSGRVMGNVYSSKEWADHYGAAHDSKSMRYVPEAQVFEERAAAVRFLRHWASLSGAFEDVEGRALLHQFAKRLEDGEQHLPPGVTTTRDPSDDIPASSTSGEGA
jgi:hypothetical protein